MRLRLEATAVKYTKKTVCILLSLIGLHALTYGAEIKSDNYGVSLNFVVLVANLPYYESIPQPDGTIKKVRTLNHDIFDNQPISYGPVLTVKNISSKIVYILSKKQTHDEQPYFGEKSLVFGIPDDKGNVRGFYLNSLTDEADYFVDPLGPGESMDFSLRLEPEEIKAIGKGPLVAGIYLTTEDPHPSPAMESKIKPMALVWSNPVEKLPDLPSK